MKILVTGGAGFIGSAIVEELREEGHDVVIVDSLDSSEYSVICDCISFYQVDIRSHALETVFQIEKPDIVIHEAAQVSVPYSLEHPYLDFDVNLAGTIKLLDLSVKHGVKKFIFASSAAIYGLTGVLPISENTAVEPLSFYGLSKSAAEKYIKLYYHNFGLPFTILRYSNVYGMRQNNKGEAGVISIFIDQVLRNQPLKIFGDGNQTRDFIFVKDVAKANIAAISYGHNQIFNISTGYPTSLYDVKSQLEQAFSRSIDVIYEDAKRGDIRDSYLSNEQAKKHLHWEPKVNLQQGLRETIQYFQRLRVQNI